jgi:hypothetical protein
MKRISRSILHLQSTYIKIWMKVEKNSKYLFFFYTSRTLKNSENNLWEKIKKPNILHTTKDV